MKVLGPGTSNLRKVGIDSHMRVDIEQLDARLQELHEARVPVLAVVGMLGTTEFGTVDPIHEIVAARGRWRAVGFDFGIHVDGAWGGYLTSMFRKPDGSFAARSELAREFVRFPSEVVYEAFRALRHCDSITIDPHKLGYVPYSAGAFVARNRDVVDFIAQGAAYVFDVEESVGQGTTRDKLHNLGQYILEGSKPGAAAAAVYVTHKVLPLHTQGFGRLLAVTVRSAEAFRDGAERVAVELADRVRLTVPFEPDSNLVCLALNPVGNASQAAMNRFGRAVFARMRVEPGQPLQIKTFIGSYTSLQKESLPGEEAHRVLHALGIDPSTFVLVPVHERQSDHIFVLRHTLMNPWLQTGPGGVSYIDLYWTYLEQVIDEVLQSGAWQR